MKFLLPSLVILLSLFSSGVECTQWVLLAAGATGYDNYRHQANICHAYQLMLSRGISRHNIITMLYDDVAYHPRNPFPGNIINEFNGPNVYAGMRIDYRGKDCNAKNFLKVLQGEEMEVGSGRVIDSREGDQIFVYYSDHGNRNILAFPGGVLYARDLNAAIVSMHEKKRYSKMVFYVEACHSGSMFAERLAKDINVYAMTAASPYESSYSCCYDRRRRTSLGDIFSGSWMRDSERKSPTETLEEQYKITKRKTTMSHVQVYGDYVGMREMKVADFQGYSTNDAPSSSQTSSDSVPMTDAVLSWEVPFVSLLHQLEDTNTTEGRLEIVHQLHKQQKAYLAIHQTMEDIVKYVSPQPSSLLFQVKETKTSEEQDYCYEASVDQYLKSCTKYQEYDYAMKELYVFENLCNERITSEKMREAVVAVCRPDS